MESGYHSDAWFELDRLFLDLDRLHPFIRELGLLLTGREIEVVCGPMTGGAKLADLVAREIGVTSVHAERVETTASGLFPVKYRVPDTQRSGLRGKRVAIVDDAISAGSALRGTHVDLIACGARPVAVGALIVFGTASEAFVRENGLSIDAVARTSFNVWPPLECPLCQSHVPLEFVSDASKK
jgi:orotate phosphoribosyltransferase